MRVIAGRAKGSHLRPVPGSTTRPITDRVKEALFDIIGADLAESSWWDMFAGTGAVGIEALSRGAAHVLLTDLNKAAVETIRANLAHTKLTAGAEPRRADAFALLEVPPDRKFDYIYVAPPQYHELWAKALRTLDRNIGWLGADGWVLIQVDPGEFTNPRLNKLEEFDRRRYGSTLLVFYRRSSSS